MASSDPELKAVWLLVLGFFMFLSAGFRGFSLVLDSRGRLGGKVVSACEEFEDIQGGTDPFI